MTYMQSCVSCDKTITAYLVIMRLTEKERQILFSAQLQANAPVPVIRKASGYREHSIRYCLQQSLETRVIEMRCFVDLCRLGYTMYTVYFSLAPDTVASREEFLSALIESPRVTWLGELGGDFQYGVTVCVRNLGEVARFLDELSERFGQIFLEKSIAARLLLSYFGNKYFAPKALDAARRKTDRKPKTVRDSFSYRVTESVVPIDELDHKILSALTAATYRSRRELARQLAVPLSTLEYRIKRLEEQQVIVGFYYQVDPQQIGVQSFLLLAAVKGIDRGLQERFWQFCTNHPNIVLAIHCLGNWDFEMAVDVEDARDIIRVTEEVRVALGGALHSLKTLPQFAYRKVCEYPPNQLIVPERKLAGLYDD